MGLVSGNLAVLQLSNSQNIMLDENGKLQKCPGHLHFLYVGAKLLQTYWRFLLHSFLWDESS